MNSDSDEFGDISDSELLAELDDDFIQITSKSADRPFSVKKEPLSQTTDSVSPQVVHQVARATKATTPKLEPKVRYQLLSSLISVTNNSHLV